MFLMNHDFSFRKFSFSKVSRIHNWETLNFPRLTLLHIQEIEYSSQSNCRDPQHKKWGTLGVSVYTDNIFGEPVFIRAGGGTCPRHKAGWPSSCLLPCFGCRTPKMSPASTSTRVLVPSMTDHPLPPNFREPPLPFIKLCINHLLEKVLRSGNLQSCSWYLTGLM